MEFFNTSSGNFHYTGGGGGGVSGNIITKMISGISFFMVSSSNLKYKLIRHVTFNPLLFWIAPGLNAFVYEIKKTFTVVKHFSRHFSVYNFLFF